ncbi:MAG TPA: hypothetical protein VGL22_15205 [Terracidiphilus sp.]
MRGHLVNKDWAKLTDTVSYDPPDEVKRFLARAVLVYGIPFQYLVPDERMLPTESVRFFFLDPGWIAIMIQGATSIGRLDAQDTVLDTTMRHLALEQAMVDAALVRGNGRDIGEPQAQAAQWPLTGFLLRSGVVDGWQGVEMKAYGADGVELAPLRIDRLAPDILLCIFNGKVAHMTVKQPPEGLHFGLSPVGNGQYQRLSLRKVTEKDGAVQPGEQIQKAGDGSRPIDAPMRSGKGRPTRVVRVAELAALFQQRLTELKQAPSVFTSGEFGVEMVESPGLVDFKLGAGNKNE